MPDPPRRIMLVGQAPNATGDPDTPLEGSAGKKIASLLKISFEEYLDRTHRMNIFSKHQGKSGKGDRFPSDKAREITARLRVPQDVVMVLLVGKNVASAYGIKKAVYFEQGYLWSSDDAARVVEVRVIPHPSGINRWWNNAKNKRTASREFKNIARAAWTNLSV